MKKKIFISLIILFVCGILFSSCAIFKHHDPREDMIMYMMFKDISAMNDVSNEQNFVDNQ